MSGNLRNACRYCRRPLATKEDVEASADTPGLCWSIVDYCDTDAESAIDAHLATIARLERWTSMNGVAELQRELEQARQDAKQSDLDAIRALGERNDAMAELAMLKARPSNDSPDVRETDFVNMTTQPTPADD